MKLIKDHWMRLFLLAQSLERRIGRSDPKFFTPEQRGMDADYKAAQAMMEASETIVLPSSVMMDLLHNIDRIDTKGGIRLPYPFICIQFTHPIPEKDIMAHEETNDLQDKYNIKEDAVQGILIGNSDQNEYRPIGYIPNLMSCTILFESTSVNRVVWLGKDKPAEPYWERFVADKLHLTKESLENKTRMIQLCYAIGLFLNAPNVIVRKEKPDPKVNAKRQKKGKEILPEYHTVRIQKFQTVYEESSGRKGSEHSRMYPVRGHFRRLKQYPEPIWIPNHFRGVKHGTESMLKEVYKVNPVPKKDK